MARQSFGGVDTAYKLEKIAEYLHKFTTVLDKKFTTIFVDAFAGTGEIDLRGDSQQQLFVDADSIIEGSAKRALKIARPFDNYIFIEMNEQKATRLESLGADFPHLASRISVIKKDANVALKDFCETTNWKSTRAVVFLDPFGNQVSWATLEKLAATRSIDLWYLFPAGLGVWRQISKSGIVVKEAERSVDLLFGRPDWREKIIKKSNEVDLFGEEYETRAKEGDANAVTEYMISLMKSIFRGGVLDEWLVLGSQGIHKYSLIFACANPSPAAHQLALTLAKAILRSPRVGRR